tara:strand:- start:45 stop:983 length:939 start_codon:yes stop_codon:yes gene_type:complete
MKKILVCGGSGFIGLNVVKYFTKQNYNVLATYNKNKPKKSYGAKWIKSDLTSLKQIKKVVKKTDIIIQCAAVTAGSKTMVSNPFLFISDNVIMNSLLIREAVQAKVSHFVFLSCTVMYHHSNKKLKETDYNPSRNLNKVYEGMALTKVYIENMCKFYAERSKTKFSALRHTNIYGPHDKFEKQNSHFMAAAISRSNHSSKKLVVWGEGNEKRDFLYIDDFCSAIKKIIDKQKVKFDLLNISYGKSFSVGEIVKIIKSIMKKNYKISFDKSKPSIKINILVDSSKMIKNYAWKTQNSLSTGIKKTVLWYKSNY